MIYIGNTLMGIGLFFFTLATMALFRFPDNISRAHGTSKCDTLGLILIFLGLIFRNGIQAVDYKLIFILLFFWFTGPTSIHIMSKTFILKEGNKLNENI
ncbi:MAG: monovalent cation/H(+) antiporter subunit G [Firmicutes bacterium]|nr:monovalent cation/H(+) antiporter subunit G [Bacillota bacterium]